MYLLVRKYLVQYHYLFMNLRGTRRQVSHFDFLLSAYFSVLSFHPCCAPRRVQGHELCMVDLMDG